MAQTTGLILGVDIRLEGGVHPLKYENPSSNYMASAQLFIKSPHFAIWAPLDDIKSRKGFQKEAKATPKVA